MKGPIGSTQSAAIEATRSIIVHLGLGHFISQHTWVQTFAGREFKNATGEVWIDFRTNTGVSGHAACIVIEASSHAPALCPVEKVFVSFKYQFSDEDTRYFECSITKEGIVPREIDKFPF